MTGLIFEIQRFSIHDGPGIRTTVFLKGCPLNCLWCHNPEGLTREPLLSFLPSRCVGCGYCFRVCPEGAHAMRGETHVLDRARCRVCGKCVAECHAGALELVGREVAVEEVLAEVLADKPFYETSGGGMTLSGGEPLMQPDFAEALLKAAKSEGLHNAVETCGFAEWERFERLLPWVDLFLFDLKETEPERHAELTGAPLAPILRNLCDLYARGAKVLLRLPVVPGYNDRPEHFEAVGAICRDMPDLLGVEVMPYHRLGEGKRERLGLPADGRPDIEPPTREAVAEWVKALRGAGANVLNEG